MVKRNIDLIKDEMRLIKKLWNIAYKEVQWRVGFAVGLITVFCLAFKGLERNAALFKSLVSVGFIFIITSVVFCFIILGKLRTDIEYTEFEDENDLYEEADKQVELEVLEQEYGTHRNIIAALRAFSKYSPLSYLFMLSGGAFLFVACMLAIWKPN